MGHLGMQIGVIAEKIAMIPSLGLFSAGSPAAPAIGAAEGIPVKKIDAYIESFLVFGKRY